MKVKSIRIPMLLTVLLLCAVMVCGILIIPANAAVNEQSGFFTKAEKDPNSYAYSIAVIGDTQTLSDSDYDNRNTAGYEKRMDILYSWIESNVEDKKIGAVLGLGDIVENWQHPLDYPTYENTALGNQSIWEWDNAGRVFNTYLEGDNGAKVPYILVRGNHDSDNAYNTFIASDAMSDYRAQYSGANAGYYVDSKGVTKYDTSFMKLTLGTTNWLIFTVDWAATERELDWIADLITANPDHRVILTMHSYLFHDRTVDGQTGSADTATPNPDWDYTTDMLGNNKTAENPEGPAYNADGIWERLVSRHSNIDFVLSGHQANDAPQRSQLVGVNGNTITQILIDPQSMDLPAKNTSGTGMVAMLYFNNDGSLDETQWNEKTVDLEWYSTIKQKHFKEANQYTVNIDLYDGGVKTDNYGIIPATYADADEYPFVVFGHDTDIDEYFFYGAYKKWLDKNDVANSAYPSLSGLSGSTKSAIACVLLRRDYDYTLETETRYAMGNLYLTVNLDLDGHKITTGDKQFFNTNLGSAGQKSTVNVFSSKAGGEFINASTYRPFISLGATSTGAGATFTYNFKDITFSLAEVTTTTDNMMVETFSQTSANNSPITISQNITFDNCTFDVSNATKAVTLFELNESVGSGYNVQSANVSIKNSKMLGDLSKAVLVKKNDTDSFSASFSDGTKYTEYGMLPASNTNPFVLFENGVYVNSYATWQAAVNAAVGLSSASERVIYMTKDYTSTAQPSIGNLSGNLLIDLGGHTLTSSGKYGFNSYFANTKAGASMSITMKNGTVTNSYKNGFLLLNTSANQTEELKIDVLFENLTFNNTTTGSYIFKAWSAINGTTVPGLDVKAVMNGCTINYDGNAKPFELVFGNGDKEKFDLTLNGCDIVSSKKANITKGALFSKDSEDNVTFGTYNGKATTFKSVDKSYTITEAIENKDTVTVFAYTSGNVLYTAKTAARAAEAPAGYSAIPDIYPKELYPFAVYKDGTVTPYISWYQAVNFAESTNGTILLRRDYSTDECHNATQSFYVKEDCVVDLGGHVFTRGAQHIIQAYGKSTSETSTVTNLTVKNGIFLVVKNPVIIFNNSGAEGNNAVFNITFEDVTFALAKNSTATDLIISNYTGGTYGSIGNIVLDNCTIDLTENEAIGSSALSNAITIFDLASDSGKNFTSVKYIGGKIIANDMSKVTIFELGASGTDKDGNERSDSFEFSKKDGESYTKLVLPASAAAPTEEFNGLKFKESSTDGTTTTYILVPTAALNLDFTPMASVTLDSNLILNIYIPDHAGLKSATLNGTPVALTNAEGGYYIVSTALEAKEAAKTLALEVVLDNGGTELKGTFTFSTVKYVQKLLATAGVTEAEKTLAKDMLAYVKSAYNYFDSADKATVAEAINSVIGNYTAALKRVDGAAASDANDILAGTTFALDSTPAIRFYLHNGSDASQFSFNVGGRLVSAEDISTGVEAAAGDFNGYNYVDISLYAYRMIENVTITKGADTATYHINYYYDNMNTANAAQVEMITAFYNYCVSANAYRAEVTK